MNRKLRTKNPKASQVRPAEPSVSSASKAKEVPVAPLKEITVTGELKFTLGLTGQESLDDVCALILRQFDQVVADKRALLVNPDESRRRVQLMLSRAPYGKSSVRLWRWPIIVLS